jgi:hypothetical protein
VSRATVPFDLERYVQQVRADAIDGECFICAIVDGRRDDHRIVARDDVSIAFLAKFPTLLGCCLVASPLRTCRP